MAISPSEAAKLVGMTKQGIIRAIHAGKLSATKNEGGQYEIDPVELFRVYDPVATSDNSETPDQSDSLRTQVTMLERMLRDKDDVIADLRQRLDVATEENVRLSAVVTSQLHPPQPQPRRGFWQRLLGGE